MNRAVSVNTGRSPGHVRGTRRGVASVLAMLFLVLFSAVALGFYAQTNMSSQVGGSERKMIEAQVAAEAGLAFVKYQLSALNVPYLPPAQRIEEIYMQLAANLDGTGNLGGGVTGYDGTTISIPEGTNSYVRVTPNGAGFRATIKINADNSLTVKIVGRYGGISTGLGRAVQVTFGTEERVAPLFNYGMAARGPVNISGNGTIRGVPDATYGSLFLTTTVNPAITMAGPSEVSGDIFLTNPSATTSINSSCFVGGATGAGIGSHVKKVSGNIPEFPAIDTSVFLPYVTNTYTAATGINLKNVRIPANTGTAASPLNIASGATVSGVMYIESPNVVNFSGSCTIRGVIIGPNTTSGGIAANKITFSGQATAYDMSTLPATSEFPAALRAMTGSSILANGFNVAFSGGYASISGTIASSQLTFSGTAGGAITGHVLGLGTQTLSISGSAQVFLDRPGTNKWPAGVFFRVRYMPKKETYLEVPVNGP